MAVRLDAGDPCAAAAAAERLRRQAIAAVNGPAVPAALKEELLGNAQSVFDGATRACSAVETPAPAPAAPPPPVADGEEDEEGDEGRGNNGKGKGKGKGKGRGRGREDDA